MNMIKIMMIIMTTAMIAMLVQRNCCLRHYSRMLIFVFFPNIFYCKRLYHFPLKVVSLVSCEIVDDSSLDWE